MSDELANKAMDSAYDVGYDEGFQAGLKRALELKPEEKEPLDKDDPDNYEACYAIAGFNDGLSKWKSNLESEIKENS